MAKHTKHAKPLIEEIARHGVSDYQIVMRGRHPALVFDWRGEKVRISFPISPGDHRGHLNTITQLRRKMGVKRADSYK